MDKTNLKIIRAIQAELLKRGWDTGVEEDDGDLISSNVERCKEGFGRGYFDEDGNELKAKKPSAADLKLLTALDKLV